MAVSPSLTLIEKCVAALIEAQNWHGDAPRQLLDASAAHALESCPVCIAGQATGPLITMAMRRLEESLATRLAAADNRYGFRQYAQDLAACDVALTRIGMGPLAPHLVESQAERQLYT